MRMQTLSCTAAEALVSPVHSASIQNYLAKVNEPATELSCLKRHICNICSGLHGFVWRLLRTVCGILIQLCMHHVVMQSRAQFCGILLKDFRRHGYPGRFARGPG